MTTWNTVYQDSFNRTGTYDGSISDSGAACVGITTSVNTLYCTGADLTVGNSGVSAYNGQGFAEAPVPSADKCRLTFTCKTQPPSLALRVFEFFLRDPTGTLSFGMALRWLHGSGQNAWVATGGTTFVETAYTPMDITTFASVPRVVVVGYDDAGDTFNATVNGDLIYTASVPSVDMTGWKPYLRIRTGSGQDTFIYDALAEQQGPPSGFWTNFRRTTEVI